MITRTSLISESDGVKFHERLKATLEMYQGDYLKVDIQFSTTQAGHYGVNYQALIIGRRAE